MHRTQNPTAPAADTDGITAVTPADVLRGAARYLGLRGWTRNVYYGGTAADAFPPACADGALGMAAYGHCVPVPGDNTDDPGFGVYRQAAGFLCDYLERTEQTLTLTLVCDDCGAHDSVAVADLFAWNDRDGQTAESVIATLRGAADDWDYAHASEDDLETYAELCYGDDRLPDRAGFLAWLGAR